MFSDGKIFPTWYLLVSFFCFMLPLTLGGALGTAYLVDCLIGNENLASAVAVLCGIVYLNLLGLLAQWVGFRKLNLGIEDTRRKVIG